MIGDSLKTNRSHKSSNQSLINTEIKEIPYYW
jgi:hypothetical protein